MNNKINVIFAQAIHLDEIQFIMNDAVLHTTAVYDYHVRDTQFMQAWFAKKQSDNLPVLVAVDSTGLVLGYGSYGIFRPFDGFRFCVENSLYVHPQHRGKSVGKQILQALITEAIQQSYHSMVAVIDAQNLNSIALHEKFGFQMAGKLHQVGYKFQQWLDLVLMEKML